MNIHADFRKDMKQDLLQNKDKTTALKRSLNKFARFIIQLLFTVYFLFVIEFNTFKFFCQALLRGY